VPGYEHDKPPYDDPKFTNYIFQLSGSGLGKEVNYTVADLEAMTDLHLEKEYSLSNSYLLLVLQHLQGRSPLGPAA
jgi:hypothetical protein